MAKKLTSYNANDIGKVISDAIGKEAELILNVSVTNIAYVDDKKITLEKVIIEDTQNKFFKSTSFTWLSFFLFGIVVGTIGTLSLVEKI